MSSQVSKRLPDGSFLLRAGFGWLIGALVFTLAASLCVNTAGFGERELGYLSSVISFFAAFTAGAMAASRNHTAGPASALITATALVLLLLTVGFLIKGEEMDTSAVLSIVSFTYAGVLSGILIHPGKKKNGKKYHFTKLT